MSEDNKPLEGEPIEGGGQDVQPQSNGNDSSIPEWAKDPEAVYRALQQTRQEAADYRVKLNQFQDAQQKQREKELEQQQQWKTLADERAAEIETLRQKAENAETLQGVFSEMLERRLETVPEHIRDLLKNQNPVDALNWLDANADKINPQRKAPSLDAGKTGERSEVASLTPAELEIVRRMNITPEKFLAAKRSNTKK